MSDTTDKRINTTISISHTSDIVPNGKVGHHIVHTHIYAKFNSDMAHNALQRLENILSGSEKPDGARIEIYYDYEQIGEAE